ncbi:hypothetical protein E4T56_gene11220 [Termitomyces sp. T112]|nr:hypothetical protein E4T56_gene11220 [Termitomyces sp. T112]
MTHSHDGTGASTTHPLAQGDTSSILHREEVPREYFVQSLRALAPNFWDKSETSDCTIIIPIPQVSGGPSYTNAAGLPTSKTHTNTSLYDPSDSGRRASESTLEFPLCLRLQLHVDYLSTHSSYIRALLSGANPLDLVHTTMNTYNGPRSDRRYSIGSELQTRREYGVRPDGVAIAREIQRELPIWYHSAAGPKLRRMVRGRVAECQKSKHRISKVGDAEALASVINRAPDLVEMRVQGVHGYRR